MDALFILFQKIVPQHLLSRMTGWLAELRSPLWLKNALIERFVKYFDVNMDEAEQPDPITYANFNEFFTRSLVAGARPIDEVDIVNPADGAISQLGAIAQGRIFQAKGQQFTTRELLGGDEERAAQFEDGQFVTIYLSPRDYHRVHMPVTGVLTGTCYIPGQLFSVNTVTAENVDGLFARNERLVCYFDTDFGPMAMVLVGAMIVAGIETVWSGQVAPPLKAPASMDYRKRPDAVTLQKGDEMGRFKLGSTVILLFPKDSVAWDSEYVAGTPTKLGAGLATRA
ncbi:MAG: phosphatidylserine decarboxylase [Halioglobus sp.]|jgi:phosphatidylserine decarboxylase